ncbi:T-cell surface glycoprotein CD3 epsilon chain-like [Salvelinus fontinalis]|uniref:T-cell surface glycoprotein CD3 epsilon chain-like n=1 Tax=Salvelinus fontinalis TaxID=8038 RepID=UPI0024859AA8|nr:T-cell surface glycoprotein CD3 epsilon chain-like [Salvelinus fontinalis]
MKRAGVYGGLVFLLIMTTVEGEGDVSFWRTTVTMTCPGNGEWYEDTNNMNKGKSIENEVNYDESKKRVYHCEYLNDPYDTEKTTTYQFYFKGKVCEDCYELNPTLVAGAIIGDLLVTGGVILIVYLRARKKSGPAAPQKPTSRSAGRGPPVVPSPDYEPLSVATRSRDIYATHRTG